MQDRDRLPETLVQARTASYGTTGLTFTTRDGVRALVDEAGGLVGGLLVAFAVVALLATAAMLAASAHARVSRDLTTIGALRAIGWTPSGLALSYALEAVLVALPAAAAGVIAAPCWCAARPTTSCATSTSCHRARRWAGRTPS